MDLRRLKNSLRCALVVATFTMLDRLHQADIAFLYQVAQRQAVTGIPFRHVNNEAKVCQHHAARSFQLTVFTVTAGQIALFFQGQHRNLVDLLDVRIQAAGSGGDHQMTGYQFFAH